MVTTTKNEDGKLVMACYEDLKSQRPELAQLGDLRGERRLDHIEESSCVFILDDMALPSYRMRDIDLITTLWFSGKTVDEMMTSWRDR
jgi:hypothetical protein